VEKKKGGAVKRRQSSGEGRDKKPRLKVNGPRVTGLLQTTQIRKLSLQLRDSLIIVVEDGAVKLSGNPPESLIYRLNYITHG
jgi:hypothetical protein